MKIQHIALALVLAVPGLLLAENNVPPEFDTPDKKFLFATVHNDVDLAQQALRAGAKLKAEYIGGGTYAPLGVCVILGNREVAQLLLEQGASLEWSNNIADSAFVLAAKHNKVDLLKLFFTYADRLGPIRAGLYERAFAEALKNGHLEVVKLLVEVGIDPISGFYRHAHNPARDRGYQGKPILCLAADHGNPAVVSYLLDECGLDANRNYGHGGNYPLWIAVSRGNLEAARILISKGADVNVTAFGDPTKMSCLAVALRCGHLDCADLLLNNGANPAAEKSDPVSLSKVTADWAGFDKYVDRFSKMGVEEDLWDIWQKEFKAKTAPADTMNTAPVGGLAAHLLEGDWDVSPADAEPNKDGSVRVAILGDVDSFEFSDSLLVRMSGIDNVEIVERNELDAVIREHELDRAGLLKHERLQDFSKMIAADSFILVSTVKLDKNKVYRLHWLDVKRGLVLNVRYASAEKGDWSEFSAKYADFFSRSLTAPEKGKRVPVSLIGVHANWATPEGKRLEKDLFHVIQHALSKQPGLLLLDRQSLDKLVAENRLGGKGKDPFHNSGLFLNVRVDVNLSSGNVQKIVLEAVEPGQSESEDLKFEESAGESTLTEDSNRIVSRFAGSLTNENDPKEPAKSIEADRKALADEAYWLYRAGMYVEAQVAIENSVALGIESAGAWKLYLMVLGKSIPTLWPETRGNDANNRRIIELEHDRLRAFEKYLKASEKGATDELVEKIDWSIYEVLKGFSHSLFRMRPVSMKRHYRNDIIELEDHFKRLFDLVIKPLCEQGRIAGKIREDLMLSVFWALPTLNLTDPNEHERLVRESISGLNNYWCMDQMYPRSVEGGFKRWNEWVRKYGTPAFVVGYYKHAGSYLFYWDGKDKRFAYPSRHNSAAYQSELAEYLEVSDSPGAGIELINHRIFNSVECITFMLPHPFDVGTMPLAGQKLHAKEYIFRLNDHFGKSYRISDSDLSRYSSVSVLLEIQMAEQKIIESVGKGSSPDDHKLRDRQSSLDAINARIKELSTAVGQVETAVPLVDAYVWDMQIADPKRNMRFSLWYEKTPENYLFEADNALWAIGKYWEKGKEMWLFRMDERTRETSHQNFTLPDGVTLNTIKPFILFSKQKVVFGGTESSPTIVLDRETLSVATSNDFVAYNVSSIAGQNAIGYLQNGNLYYTAVPRYLQLKSGLIKGDAAASGLVFLKLDLNTMQHTVLFNFRRKPAETPLDHPLEYSNPGGRFGFFYNEKIGMFAFIHNNKKYEYNPENNKFTELSAPDFHSLIQDVGQRPNGWQIDADNSKVWAKPRERNAAGVPVDGGISLPLYNYKTKSSKTIGLRLKPLAEVKPTTMSEVGEQLRNLEHDLFMPSARYSALVFQDPAKFIIIENSQLSEALNKAVPAAK